MTLKHVTGLAFVLNVLLGNVCLVNIAEAVTLVYDASGVSVMSKINAVDCPWIRAQQQPVSPEESPCASGECITTPPPQTFCFFSAAQEIPAPVLPAAWPELDIAPMENTDPPPVNERPPPLLAVATVVLRR